MSKKLRGRVSKILASATLLASTGLNLMPNAGNTVFAMQDGETEIDLVGTASDLFNHVGNEEQKKIIVKYKNSNKEDERQSEKENESEEESGSKKEEESKFEEENNEDERQSGSASKKEEESDSDPESNKSHDANAGENSETKKNIVISYSHKPRRILKHNKKIGKNQSSTAIPEFSVTDGCDNESISSGSSKKTVKSANQLPAKQFLDIYSGDEGYISLNKNFKIRNRSQQSTEKQQAGSTNNTMTGQLIGHETLKAVEAVEEVISQLGEQNDSDTSIDNKDQGEQTGDQGKNPQSEKKLNWKVIGLTAGGLVVVIGGATYIIPYIIPKSLLGLDEEEYEDDFEEEDSNNQTPYF